MKLHKCPVCGRYTLKNMCPKCNAETIFEKPPKFSPEDVYGKYRRMMKKELEKNV